MTIFKYTDSRRNALLVELGTNCIAVYMHGVGTSSPVLIPNADVPTVAAEMLQAAGHHYLAGYIEGGTDLQERSENAEAEAAENKLSARRDAIAQEFSESCYDDFDPTSPFVHAIDRIIQLEDAATP